MKKMLILGAVFASMTSTAIFAEQAKPAVQKPVSEWTCSDFLAVDEDFYPTAVGVGELISKTGKVEDAVLDVAGIETVTPALVAECQKDPNASFLSKVKKHL